MFDDLEPLPIKEINVTEFIHLNENELEETLETAWLAKIEATENLVKVISARMIANVREYLPTAKTIVLREDTSHLPPHGHVDDILDNEGNSVIPDSETWHDLEWTMAVDEDAWDIYHLNSLNFVTRDDGIRRLKIVMPD